MAAEPIEPRPEEDPLPAGPPVEADPVDGLPSLESEPVGNEASGDDGGRGSAGRVVAANSAWRLVAFAAKATGGIVATALLFRAYGKEGLGAYQLGSTFTTVIAFSVALGLPNFLVREVARRPSEARRWVEGGIFCTLCAGVLVTGLIVAGVGALPINPTLSRVLILAGVALTFDATSQILYALFWAWQRMRFEALAISVQETVFVVATILVIRADGGPAGVMAAYLATRALGAAVAWTVASVGLRGPVVPRFDRAFLRPTLRKAVPFAADDALSATYIRADTLILGVMKGEAAVGLYTACTNLVLYMNVLPRMLNSALFAPLSKAWPREPARFARLRDASLRVLGALAMPIGVGSVLLAPRILTFIYGVAATEAATCYRLLALVIPVRMLGHTLGTALTSSDGQTKRTFAVGVAAVSNVVLNVVIFVPLFSFNGAAAATVVTETGLFAAYAVILTRVSGRPRIVEAVSLPAVACLPLAAAVLLTWNAPLPVAVLAGAVGYGLGMLGVAYVKAPSSARSSPREVFTSFVKA
jgi:O-antigen/teichoic acid export membrane protein